MSPTGQARLNGVLGQKSLHETFLIGTLNGAYIFLLSKTTKLILLDSLLQERRMNAPRVFLAARSLLRVPSRGKALENWARPSIDEIGVPTESWKQVHDKNQSKFLIHLLVGIVAFAGSATYFATNVNMYGTPHHLLKNK